MNLERRAEIQAEQKGKEDTEKMQKQKYKFSEEQAQQVPETCGIQEWVNSAGIDCAEP